MNLVDVVWIVVVVGRDPEALLQFGLNKHQLDWEQKNSPMGSSSPHHTRSLLNMEPEARVRQTDREINLDKSLVINICNWIAICCYIYLLSVYITNNLHCGHGHSLLIIIATFSDNIAVTMWQTIVLWLLLKLVSCQSGSMKATSNGGTVKLTRQLGELVSCNIIFYKQHH